MRHFCKKKVQNFQIFSKNVSRFFSLRYSADFRRSCLVIPAIEMQSYQPRFQRLSKLSGDLRLARKEDAR